MNWQWKTIAKLKTNTNTRHTYTHEQTYTNGHTKTDVGNRSQLSNLRMHKMPNIPNRIEYFFISVFCFLVSGEYAYSLTSTGKEQSLGLKRISMFIACFTAHARSKNVRIRINKNKSTLFIFLSLSLSASHSLKNFNVADGKQHLCQLTFNWPSG